MSATTFGRHRGVAALACLALLTLMAASLRDVGPLVTADRSSVSVIVRAAAGAGDGPRRLVESAGGQVRLNLPILNGFAASVPRSRLEEVRRGDGVASVTPDTRLALQSTDDDVAEDPGSTAATAQVIEAPYMWERGYTGEGVGIALIDSGTVPVEGLTDNVFHGPDLSFEGADEELRHLDTYGHGTHLAGIAAGRDSDWSLIDTDGDGDGDTGDPEHFAGIAPDATVISVKVAMANGFADVSQVIAAIDWVVQHRHERNIRVLNLAFGTDGVQDYQLDPLTHAVEIAWRRGIVVVAAAGNQGLSQGRLVDPAYDPFVIAVGADDPGGTKPTHDDVIPSWSSRGDGHRDPDVVAPGASIVALRVPGSYVDRRHPAARVGERYFRGSGTSQAAAVVSGAVALLLDERPELSPDQIKDLLVSTASPVPEVETRAQGAGLLNVKKAAQSSARQTSQDWTAAAGLGLLDTARGSMEAGDLAPELTGEVDASGALWDALTWSVAASEGTSWSAGGWTGMEWSGGEWNEGSWLGNSWSGNSWSDGHWSGVWTGNSWSGDGWTGNSWSEEAWATAGWE